MREIRKSGSMRGEGKRGDAHAAQATAPLLYSTKAEVAAPRIDVCFTPNRRRRRRSSACLRLTDVGHQRKEAMAIN